MADRGNDFSDVYQNLDTCKRKTGGQSHRSVHKTVKKLKTVDDPGCNLPRGVEAAKEKQIEEIPSSTEISHAEEVNNNNADWCRETDSIAWDFFNGPLPDEDAKGDQVEEALHGTEIIPAETEEVKESFYVSDVLRKLALMEASRKKKHLMKASKKKNKGTLSLPVVVQTIIDLPACSRPTGVESAKGKQVEETPSGPEIISAGTEEVKESFGVSDVLRKLHLMEASRKKKHLMEASKKKNRGTLSLPAVVQTIIDLPACSRPTGVEAAKGKQVEETPSGPEISHAEEVSNKNADWFSESDSLVWKVINEPSSDEDSEGDQVEETLCGNERWRR